MNRARALWSTRPRSTLELYECCRDDVILMPQFQYVWWCTGCCVVLWEFAAQATTEFCCMEVMCYIIFTLPCLRFCTVWTRLYQQRRNPVHDATEDPEEGEPRQKKKKAMTEEEMLQATRTRQKNRAGEGGTKSFAPPKKAKKKEQGAQGGRKVGVEENIVGAVSELQVKKFTGR